MKEKWLSRLLQRLSPRWKQDNGGSLNGQVDVDTIKQMVRGIVTTRSDEIGCDECFEQVDRFAEMVLQGKNAAEAMPLVEDHLRRCKDCHEEYQALLEALRAVN
jgi:hypothetical protein